MTAGWRSLLLWSAGALLIALTLVTFIFWGRNGAAYLVDLVETYCT
jgi:hypothetical protein